MLPRLVVAAPASGQGKTTVATGLMAALRRTGSAVSGHKVGPDYIDPGFHALATGRPGRNLDPHLVGPERIVPLLLHGAREADIAVVEGVMGLFDGKVGTDGYASTAHLATLTSSPVLLVVDASAASRTVGAVVHGLAAFEESVRVGGVILNKVGSPRHADEVRSAVARTGVPVLGALPRDAGLTMPSRHLGLVPAAERDEAVDLLDRLASRIAEHIDLDAVRRLASSAPDLDGAAWDPATVVRPPSSARPVVAMAGGRAFTFRYAETEELLRAAGCEVVAFDPLRDRSLPAGTAGIYLGGGFPEVHAPAIADNAPLLAQLRDAIARGVPTVAECAGLLYLCRALDDAAMVGALDADAAMTERLTLRYPAATAAADSLLTRTGETVTGHEFHRTRVAPAYGERAAWRIGDDLAGFATDTLHASYLHTHWAGHPQLAQRFADATHHHAEKSKKSAEKSIPEPERSRTATAVTSRAEKVTSRPAESTLRPAEPLRHHGDSEAVGMRDFAVNVYAGARPLWLDEALRGSLRELDRYPDPGPAERALAQHHGRPVEDVLATAGAAEAFTLIARLRGWRRPVVVHPQFTEPHAALVDAGHDVTTVTARAEDGFALDPDAVPDDADLVVLGNPTNPTGVLHPAASIEKLLRDDRLVVVDEAFMDTVPGEAESLTGMRTPGLVVVRSLTKHWSIPGVRAGYLLGDTDTVAALRRTQTPWSVSAPAIAAMTVCATEQAAAESRRRAETLAGWRRDLEAGLDRLGVAYVPSSSSFVLARVGAGLHERLRHAGIAVRRADTFPGLDDRWVRIAVRPPDLTAVLLTELGHQLSHRGDS